MRFASVAQLVEQGTENPRVVGSIPIGGTICGFSSFGRARPCQGRGGGFEPRNPLQSGHENLRVRFLSRRHSQAVRQRSAKPSSPVRFRVAPPEKAGPNRVGFFCSHRRIGPAPPENMRRRKSIEKAGGIRFAALGLPVAIRDSGWRLQKKALAFYASAFFNEICPSASEIASL